MAFPTQNSNNVNSNNLLNSVLNSINIIVQYENNEKTKWYLEIPKIDLKAEIYEGTTSEVMDKYIGHLEGTSNIYGNVGLAAHNRGYKVNYFANLKNLKIGDEIIYNYYGIHKKYVITKISKIKDTNWEVFLNTKENQLTLITCVANEPKYRLCVQAIEMEE